MKLARFSLLCILFAAPVLAADDLIAIDVLLVPDETMMRVSAEWNAVLRAQVPSGFTLDDAHQPHVTLIQRHIDRDNLDAVLDAIATLRAEIDLDGLEMTANGLYHIPAGDIGLAGITVAPSAELRQLQDAVISVVNPFDAGPADEAAYVPDPTGTPFDPLLFDYVTTFVPAQSGDNFNPHVTTGIGPTAWLEMVETLPFNPFTFKAVDIAVYQLGNFGTAAKRLDQ